MGLNYFDLEQYNLALEQFEKARELKPADFDIQEAIFKVYEQQKKYDKAIDIAKTLAQEKPEYFEILANIFLITKQYQKALLALDKADDKQGYDAHKDQLREIIFKEQAKPEVAVNYYQKRIDLEPFNPMNAYRLVSFLIKDKAFEKALKESKLALENHPRFSRFYVLQIDIYLKLNQVDQAFKALENRRDR